ncbi:MAG: hypothetical protein Q27BB25_14235 [Blastomonas sp. CACIA14H2]|nr:MAG: hypothetical protein Q27BB25_14235 [Blastomonas sp. CACIA14H2]
MLLACISTQNSNSGNAEATDRLVLRPMCELAWLICSPASAS